MMLDPRFKAISFDLDDTLLHTHITNEKIARWFKMACLELCVDESVLAKKGEQFVNVCEWIKEKRKCATLEEASEFFTETINDIAAPERGEPTAVEGIFEILVELRGRGYKLAILSNGFGKYMKINVEKFGLNDYFDVIIGFNDLPFGCNKPNPEAIRILAEKLGVKPCEILHIGDSIEDYQCAVGAGAGFIGVVTGRMSREEWASLSEDVILMEKSSDLLD